MNRWRREWADRCAHGNSYWTEGAEGKRGGTRSEGATAVVVLRTALARAGEAVRHQEWR